MARARDYGAEYRARVERGKRLGLTLRQSIGKARPDKGERSIRELRSQGEYRYQPKRPASRPPKVTDTAAGRMVNTADAREIRRQLVHARRLGHRVAILLTVDKGDGAGPRSRYLHGTAPQAAVLRDAGQGGAGEPSGIGRGDVIGKVRMVIGSAEATAGGMDPAQLLALIDVDYEGDLWGALGDLWDSEYS